MAAAWVMEDMQSVDLKDKRLDERAKTVLTQLGERPTASIPAACGGNAETKAAYRFFDNDKATPDGILQPHYESTCRRIAAHPVALLAQDTSEIDLSRPEQQVVGAGRLDGGNRRGLFLHAMQAFTPAGTPLGSVWTQMHVRPDEEAGTDSSSRTSKDKDRQRKELPIDEKESFRWLQGMRKAREVAKQCPETTCVCLADSEGDIYEVLCEEREVDNCHWLIRACYDRALVRGEAPGPKLLVEAVENAPVLSTFKIQLRGREQKVSCEARKRRKTRQAREAEVAVRAMEVTLRPPRRPDRKLPEVTVGVVLVREIDPPDGEEPVEWLLLTTLPIATLEEVLLVVQYYCVRWWIEVFFRTLKTGCRAEKRLFEHIDRFMPCLSIYLIVAWRTMFVTHMGRNAPDAPCTIVFEEAEWMAVWMAMCNAPLPERPPALREMTRMIAQLGGYVNHPNRKDPPGAETTWRGLQRMYDLAWAWNCFGPGAHQ